MFAVRDLIPYSSDHNLAIGFNTKHWSLPVSICIVFEKDYKHFGIEILCFFCEYTYTTFKE